MPYLPDTSAYSIQTAQQHFNRRSWVTGAVQQTRIDQILTYTWPAAYSAAAISIQDPDGIVSGGTGYLNESGDNLAYSALHGEYREVYVIPGAWTDV